MIREKCQHESVHIDEVKVDMVGICDNCGEKIYISNIKKGLYAIDYEDRIYLLNTIKDMDLNSNPYRFEINGHKIYLYKNINKELKSGSARQLCKKMDNDF